MKKLLYNARIILPDSVEDGWVLVEDDKIAETGTGEAPVSLYADSYDCGRKYLSPGFIEMHSHGGGGHDFMDGDVVSLKEASMEHLRHGTTSITPTTLTCPAEELFSFFDTYRKAKECWTDGPELLGIHLEGPFFSPYQLGAQDPRYLQAPTPENYMPILEKGGEDIRRVSVAVELDGAMELGQELKHRGIIAAIGHSNATYSEVKEAVKNGYTMVTHLYSGMSSLHREGPYRVLGVVESAYLLDELDVEIIADGKHLPPELLQLILKIKDNDRISLITDSMRGAGMKEGEIVLLGSKAHGQEAIIRDGVAMMPDMKAFAGSVCTADRCVRTIWRDAGAPLYKAVKMMSLNPARVLGVDRRKGSIEKGKDADLILFDDDVNVRKAMVRGKGW